VFVFIGTAMVGVAVVVGIFGPKTNRLLLEHVSH
jgi:hypothetical protein